MVNNLGLATNRPKTPSPTPLNDLIPYITIRLTISPYGIDITLTNECETNSTAVMIPGEQSKKAGERKRKGYCIHFYPNLPSSPYMHHLHGQTLRFYSHIYRYMEDTTCVDWGWVCMESHIVHFSASAPGLILYTVSPPTHICQYVWSSLGGMCPEAPI